MADKVLREKRRLFVPSVTPGTINGLLDELLEKKVLNQEEMEKIRVENATVVDKARALMDSVLRKGPRACQICSDCICEDDSHLARKLELPSDNQILERSVHTRLALVICNTEFVHLSKRNGADIDIKKYEETSEKSGIQSGCERKSHCFDAHSAMMRGHMGDQCSALFQNMGTELVAFASHPKYRTSDSTFVVFMSHGVWEGICGTKYSQEAPDILDVNTIFQALNTASCPNLVDKPKVIIIQACCGVGKGVAYLSDSAGSSENSSSLSLEDLEDDAIKKAHVEKDFIAFCSSTPGTKNFKDLLETYEYVGKFNHSENTDVQEKEEAWKKLVEADPADRNLVKLYLI